MAGAPFSFILTDSNFFGISIQTTPFYPEVTIESYQQGIVIYYTPVIQFCEEGLKSGIFLRSVEKALDEWDGD
jgi:hypothetical protein